MGNDMTYDPEISSISIDDDDVYMHNIEDDDHANDDEVDEIVDERPIVLLPSQSIHLFQFPTMQSLPPYLNPTGKMKKNAKQVQMKVDLHLSNGHYDFAQAQRFGQGLDNNAIQTVYDLKRGVAAKEPQKPLDFIQLESKKMPLNATYFAATMQEETLVLRPIDSVLQFRPKLEYLDRIQEKEKQANQRIADEERDDTQKGKEGEARIVQVSVRNQDKETMEKASLAQLRQAAENEPWVDISVYPEHSSESMHLRSQLFNLGERDSAQVLNKHHYFNTICPELGEQIQVSEPRLRSAQQQPSANDTQLYKTRLKIRMQKWLATAHVVQHATVLEIFESESEETVIETLQQIAVLVQGLWIIRSEFIYNDRLCLARNYLLYLFSQNERISRESFCEVTRLNHIMSHAMFGEIATLDRHARLWTLKLLPDSTFAKEHDNLVKWSAPILDEFAKRARLEFGVEYDSQRRIDTGTPESSQSGPSFEHKRKLFMKLITMHPVFSQNALLEHLRKKNLIEDSDEKLVCDLLDDVTIQKGDTRILAHTGTPDVDEFLPTAASLFSKQDKVKKGDINAVWTEQLGKTPSPSLYSRILQFIAVSRGGQWSLLSPSVKFDHE